MLRDATGTRGDRSRSDEVTIRGLTPAEVEARRSIYGSNEIPRAPAPSVIARLWEHARSPMNALLAAAALVSGALLGERMEAVAIFAIVALNIGIGLAQEVKASRSLEALKGLQTPTARVVRASVTSVVPARELVPGDVMVLAAGDLVAADATLVDAQGIEVDESMLTGESLPVAKVAGAEGSDPRGAAVFAGSVLTTGFGHAVVTAIGGETELGAIAAHLQQLQPPTPLQLELEKVSARLGIAALVLAAGIFGLIAVSGSLNGSLERAFLSAVALAVAAVPEGLATVVTVALALGVRRMAEHGAIVRTLPAVETLGSTDVIVTDKTGTLTQNRLAVASIVLPSGRVLPIDRMRDWLGHRMLLRTAILCNDLEPGGAGGESGAGGDPLERALLDLAGRDEAERIRMRCPRVGGSPFDSKRKLMTTLNSCEGGLELFVKGAPEVVVPLSSRGLSDEGAFALTGPDRERVLDVAAAQAEKGARLLALATRRVGGSHAADSVPVEGLTLAGIVAFRDPVRAEAAAAVGEARKAGVRVVMVTGDHPGTASAIAREVGISPAAAVIEGRSRGAVESNVFARALPDDKVQIVEDLRAAGRVVAVTGDGVNDVPALRRADIGVAMGRGGSDAAKEAADLVITDDDLATIVSAIRQGRGIYDNIRKVIDYLVAANISEVLLVLACLLLVPALGIPLTPLQILWINLVTDGLPAIALSIDEIDRDVMSRRPRSRRQRLLDGARLRLLVVRGALLAAGASGVLLLSRVLVGSTWPEARTAMFVALVVAQLAYAWTLVAAPKRAWGSGRGWLTLGTALGAAASALLVLVPAARGLFDTVPLGPAGWALALLVGVAPAFLIRRMSRDR